MRCCRWKQSVDEISALGNSIINIFQKQCTYMGNTEYLTKARTPWKPDFSIGIWPQFAGK